MFAAQWPVGCGSDAAYSSNNAELALNLVEELAQSASFHAWEKSAPSNAGTKQLLRGLRRNDRPISISAFDERGRSGLDGCVGSDLAKGPH
jgi:hypothetical protein